MLVKTSFGRKSCQPLFTLFQPDGTYAECGTAIGDSFLQEMSSSFSGLSSASISSECMVDVERYQCKGDFTRNDFCT